MKYQFLLHKAYFDKGFALTGYVKYALAFVGLYDIIDAKAALIFAALYILACYCIGFCWFRYGFTDTENEIQNRFNPFQKEVREKLLKRKA